MRPLTVKVPRDLEERLDQLARQRGVSRSTIVREALEAYAARPASGLAAVHDLVGAFEGGPRDLSTNPRHLEGFGRDRPARRRATRRPA